MKNLIWDVHEDPAAALQVKSWMPKILRRPVAGAWRRAEWVAERQHHLLLAEHACPAEVPSAASRGCQLRTGPEGRRAGRRGACQLFGLGYDVAWLRHHDRRSAENCTAAQTALSSSR